MRDQDVRIEGGTVAVLLMRRRDGSTVEARIDVGDLPRVAGMIWVPHRQGTTGRLYARAKCPADAGN